MIQFFNHALKIIQILHEKHECDPVCYIGTTVYDTPLNF